MRVANLVENILQFKFEDLLKSGGEGLELQEAGECPPFSRQFHDCRGTASRLHG